MNASPYREYLLGGPLHGRDRLDVLPDFDGDEMLCPVPPDAATFRAAGDDVHPVQREHVVYERHVIGVFGTGLTVWTASPSLGPRTPVAGHAHELAALLLAPHRRRAQTDEPRLAEGTTSRRSGGPTVADDICGWCAQTLRRTATPFRTTYTHHYGTAHLCPGPQGTNGVVLDHARADRRRASTALAAQLRQLDAWFDSDCRCGAPPAWYDDGERQPCGNCEASASVLAEAARVLEELEEHGRSASVPVFADWRVLEEEPDGPQPGETVWIYDAKSYGVVLGEHTGTRWISYFDDPGVRVTHWAPLHTPAAPEVTT